MAMRRELATELGYIHNYKTGKRGILSKIPFCWDVDMDDLIMICCKLQAQKFGIAQQAQQSGKDSAAARDTYIMREGDLGDEMFIITEGAVRIERSEHTTRTSTTFESGTTFEPGTTFQSGGIKNLGKLQELDFFGELAVLTIDENGKHFPRTRSAICASSSCMVQSLNYSSLQELRTRSSTIDAAVRMAVSQVYTRRPSLRRRAGTSTQERFEKLEDLNAQVLGLQKEIAQEMLDLKDSISATP
jgi:CRP-like cAMP-binding protein